MDTSSEAEQQRQAKLQFVPCPTCGGFGYELTGLGHHRNCTVCVNRASVYAQLEDKVLTWRRPFNRLSIIQNRAQQYVEKLITVLLALIGVFGFLVLFYAIALVYKDTGDWGSLLNVGGNNLMLLFWCTLIIDLFAYYRMEQRIRERRVIKGRSFGKKVRLKKIEHKEWKKLRKMDQDDKIDIAEYFTKDAINLIEEAYKLAQKLKHDEIRPGHLLALMGNYSQISVIYGRLGINYKTFAQKVANILHRESKPIKGHGTDIDLGLDAKKAFFIAYYEAYQHRRKKVGVTEILTATLQVDQLIADLFYDLEIDLRKLYNVIEWIYIRKKLQEQWTERRKKAAWKPKGHMNRALTARPTPMLDSMAIDFTQKARSGGFFPLIGREKEVAEAFRVLKEGMGNVLLVGESGAGKSTILQGIAELMTAEDVPVELQDKRLLVLDPGSLIAGAAGIGALEQRIQQVIMEIAGAGNVILCIEDIHHLLGAGSTGSSADVGGILMNYLSQGYLHVIGTTTTPEFQQYIANKETFLRRFQVVKIPEMNHDESIQVLEGRSGAVEYKQKVYFSYDALEACVELSDRYIKDRHLPSKALDIMEETAILARELRGEKAIVTKDDVAKILGEKTNVPIASVSKSEAQKLLNLEEIMHKRLIGQEEAVVAVARALRRSREELRDMDRPIANFLFLGPTGVGKTETAKTLAEVYFGDEKNMYRVDMSEYQEKSSLQKLIGSPEQSGQLTEALRLKPFTLLLLDELEKAHPDILNVFLQVMDDGRITDGRGRTIDCTNIILVATSNAGSQYIQKAMIKGMTPLQVKTRLMEGELAENFRPEFLNRFDDVVVFRPLTKEEIYQVAQLLLNKLAQQLLNKGIVLEATEEAVQELAEGGFDPMYGARPLKRFIQDTVNDSLAKLLLEKKVDRRDRVVLEAGGQIRVIKAERI